MLICIETHRTCDFPGGGGSDPYPPSGSAHEHKVQFACAHNEDTSQGIGLA